LYLPAANTLGLSANSTNIARVNSTGLSIGTAITPAARLQIGTTALSSTAWTTSGLGLRIDAATYTSSAGLTGTVVTHSVAQPTFAATTVSQTVTNAATLYIAAAPAAGTNVTITNSYALYIADGRNYMGGLLALGQASQSAAVGAVLKFGSNSFTFAANTYATGSLISIPDGNGLTFSNAPDNSVNCYVNYLGYTTISGNNDTGTTWDNTATLFVKPPSVNVGSNNNCSIIVQHINDADVGIQVSAQVNFGTAIKVTSGKSTFAGPIIITNLGSTSGGATSSFNITGNKSSTLALAGNTEGLCFNIANATYTGVGTGTFNTTLTSANRIGIPTLVSSAAQTLAIASTVTIAGAPVASTNVTITNPYALYVAAGASFFGGATTLNSGGALSGTFTGAPTLSGAVSLSGGGSLSGTFTGTPTFSGAVVLSGTPSISNGAALTGTFSGNPAFSGNSRFGGTSAATVAVDVTGAVLATGNVTGGYSALANGATAMAFGSYNVVKVTPTANATYTTTVPAAGTRLTLIVLTSGTSSYTITFGTGFKTTGTLATGTVTARYFMISFVSDGTNVLETARTVAIA
jgi:hypothetical protein